MHQMTDDLTKWISFLDVGFRVSLQNEGGELLPEKRRMKEMGKNYEG